MVSSCRGVVSNSQVRSKACYLERQYPVRSLAAALMISWCFVRLRWQQAVCTGWGALPLLLPLPPGVPGE